MTGKICRDATSSPFTAARSSARSRTACGASGAGASPASTRARASSSASGLSDALAYTSRASDHAASVAPSSASTARPRDAVAGDDASAPDAVGALGVGAVCARAPEPTSATAHASANASANGGRDHGESGRADEDMKAPAQGKDGSAPVNDRRERRSRR